MNEIILYIGFGIFIIGGIGFLITAFRSSILWGLLYYSCRQLPYFI